MRGYAIAAGFDRGCISSRQAVTAVFGLPGVGGVIDADAGRKGGQVFGNDIPSLLLPSE